MKAQKSMTSTNSIKKYANPNKVIILHKRNPNLPELSTANANCENTKNPGSTPETGILPVKKSS